MTTDHLSTLDHDGTRYRRALAALAFLHEHGDATDRKVARVAIRRLTWRRASPPAWRVAEGARERLLSYAAANCRSLKTEDIP